LTKDDTTAYALSWLTIPSVLLTDFSEQPDKNAMKAKDRINKTFFILSPLRSLTVNFKKT